MAAEKDRSVESSDSTLAMLTVEAKMREQIKELQEKRAAAMMNEITELQRDRDIALSRLKQLEKVINDLQKENLLLKDTCGKEANLNLEIKTLERSLLEETLITSDLKKKLQNAEKRNTELLSKLEGHSPMLQQRRSRLLQVESNLKDRSHSMNDLQLISQENKKPEIVTSGSPTLVTAHSSRLLVQPASSPSPSPVASPQLVTRKYKLASVPTCNQTTQTDISSIDPSTMPESLPRPVLEALAAARDDLLRLQEQNKDLNTKLCNSKEQTEVKQVRIMQRLDVLQQESGVLRESLSQFSQWVQHKIASVEEEMDICKVIYSLHGSLSKDTKTIEELQDKLIASESLVQHLTSENNHLAKTLTDTESRLLNSQDEARVLRQQLQQAITVSTTPLPNDLRYLSSHHPHTLSLPSPLLRQRDGQRKSPERSQTYQPKSPLTKNKL